MYEISTDINVDRYVHKKTSSSFLIYKRLEIYSFKVCIYGSIVRGSIDFYPKSIMVHLFDFRERDLIDFREF